MVSSSVVSGQWLVEGSNRFVSWIGRGNPIATPNTNHVAPFRSLTTDH